MSTFRENCLNCSETFYTQSLSPLEHVDFTFGGQKITLIGCFVESSIDATTADCPKICRTCLELLRTTFVASDDSFTNANRKPSHICVTCSEFYPANVMLTMNLTVIQYNGQTIKLVDSYKSCTKQDIPTAGGGGNLMVCLACVSKLANYQRLDGLADGIKTEPIFSESLVNNPVSQADQDAYLDIKCEIEPEIQEANDWVDDFAVESPYRQENNVNATNSELVSNKRPSVNEKQEDFKHENNYECAFCAKQFGHKSKLIRHMEKYHTEKRTSSKKSIRFPCTECRRTFPRKYGLQRHQMNKHFQQTTYECHHCARFKTLSKSTMEEHLLTRHFDCEQKCEHCNEMLPDRKAYVKHVAKHQAAKELRCPGCKRTFSRQQTYDKHMMFKTVVVQCQQCDAAFHSARALDIHLENEHNKVYICEICKFPLYKLQTYIAHKRVQHGVHSKPRCRYCGLEFETTGQLAAHRNKEHESRDYICELCGKGFLRKYTMVAHLKLHTNRVNADKANCHLCGKELKNEKSLASHIKAIHLKQNQRSMKPVYTCPKCPQWKFSRHQALEGHMIVHNTENRTFFQCFTCGIAYTRKQKYDIHILKCQPTLNNGC